MRKLKIKTHNSQREKTEFEFYILNKGNNSGKPLDLPCPNCFVCICKDEEEKQQLYWLFYGLWQGLFFNPFISGSVIPYIRIDDVKQVAEMSLSKIELQPLQFDKNVSMVQLLNEKVKVIQEQIKLIKQAKRALMYQVLK